jgi:hypothetical protein
VNGSARAGAAGAAATSNARTSSQRPSVRVMVSWSRSST